MTAWLRPPDPDPAASVRLFLLHYAGGGIAMYSRWPALLPGDIACQRVHLPGRHERHREPPFTSLPPLLDALVKVFAADLDDRPTVLFGHSMGALLAYRLAVALPRAGLAAPALLAVSGWPPTAFSPASGDPAPAAEEAGVNTDALQADLAVVASYRDDGAEVGCPIVAYAGSDDPLAPAAAMGEWEARAAKWLGCRQYPGDHFFIHDHTEAIVADLVHVIQQSVP
jgi:surfactin synthase thioesterase subunit